MTQVTQTSFVLSGVDPANIYIIRCTDMNEATQEDYVVPAVNITAAVAGVAQVLFTDIGFIPKANTPYQTESYAVGPSGAAGVSIDSAVLAWSYQPIAGMPAGCTNFLIEGEFANPPLP